MRPERLTKNQLVFYRMCLEGRGGRWSERGVVGVVCKAFYVRMCVLSFLFFKDGSESSRALSFLVQQVETLHHEGGARSDKWGKAH